MEANKPFNKIKKPIPNSINVIDDIYPLQDATMWFKNYFDLFMR